MQLKSVVFFLCLFILSSAFADDVWLKGENPNEFLFPGEQLETRFTKLRLKASVNEKGMHTPWSDTYWPGMLGGIADRYLNGPGQGARAFHAAHPSLNQLKLMSAVDLRNFSASEKLDILKGKYDYPLTNEVLSQYHPDDPSWIGICHGWTAAAINYPEPKPVTMINQDGIILEFGSSDIKALMAYFYAWKVAQQDFSGTPNWGSDDDTPTGPHYWQKDSKTVYFDYRQLGTRCDGGIFSFFKKSCKQSNLNPATFYLALSNLVGNYQRSFVVDVDPSGQVWNQPILGYETIILDRNGWTPVAPEADGADASSIGPEVNRILVKTSLSYVAETYPGFAVLGIDGEKIKKKYLKYWLELDAHDHIVGGKWSGGLFTSAELQTDYIGFAWRASRVPFSGDFEELNSLYKSDASQVNSYSSGLNVTPGLGDLNL